MIQVNHLSKSFGDVAAVRDISFTAPNGAITGILGENGAGKTTTLAMICGLLPSDGGSVRVGPETTPLERRRHLGALLDHKGLYDRLTARENITYFGRLQGISPKSAGRAGAGCSAPARTRSDRGSARGGILPG